MKGSSPHPRKAIVLDTIAFFSGYSLMLHGKGYTVPQVLEEVKDSESIRRLYNAIESGKIVSIDPPDCGLEQKIGDKKLLKKLSTTDIKLLCLMIYLRKKGGEPVIVTDDYAVQTAAVKLGFDYIPVRYRGIKKDDFTVP
jgi:UPF0271 protein